MKQITITIPDSFYNSFVEFIKHLPEVAISTETNVDIPQWHKNVLDQRLAEYLANPNAGKSLEDFEKELDA